MNTRHPLQFTEEEVQARSSDYVCHSCGVQFLTEQQLSAEGGTHTASVSECGLCRAVTSTMHIRIYNWLRIPQERWLPPGPGRLVTLKDGRQGRTFNRDKPVNGKQVVYAGGGRLLCDPAGLKTNGYID